MKNKLKLSLIAIATIVVGNVNAQTYYSCIPEECPAGQYFNGRKCLSLPTVSKCSAGYLWDESQSACFKETCTYKFKAAYVNSVSPGVSYSHGKYSIDNCGRYEYTATMKHGDCITYTDIYWKIYTSSASCYNDGKSTYCCNER